MYIISYFILLYSNSIISPPFHVNLKKAAQILPAQSRKLVLIKSNWVFSLHVVAAPLSFLPIPHSHSFPPPLCCSSSLLFLFSFSSFGSGKLFRFLHVAFACEWGKVNNWVWVWVQDGQMWVSVSEWIATHGVAGTRTRTHLTLTRGVYMRHWAAPWTLTLSPCHAHASLCALCVRPFLVGHFLQAVWLKCLLALQLSSTGWQRRGRRKGESCRDATCGGFCAPHQSIRNCWLVGILFLRLPLHIATMLQATSPFSSPSSSSGSTLLSRQCVMYGRSVCGHAVDTRINMT